MKVWQFIHDKLQRTIDVMLLYVLESNGSSPGRQGFAMAVAADGELCGSIGGGIMEHKFVELAKARLAENKDWNDIQKQVHDKTAGSHQSGMICSGDQTIFLYKVKPADAPAIQQVLLTLQEHKNGTLNLEPGGISFSAAIPATDYHFEQYTEEDFLLTEKIGFKNVLHIIGGGHCALALSRLMSQLDFYIHVYDERAGLNTMEQNNYAHSKTIVEDYSMLGQQITGGNNIYVVIMSFGYRTDSIAVKALWGKEFKYLGLLGSKKKIEKLFADFSAEELDAGYATKIHSPIGLPIHSKTPAEIAISIAAEIIGVKNKI